MSGSRITDEAVEKAASVVARAGSFGLEWEALTEPTREIWRFYTRAALDEVWPSIQPVDIADAIRDEFLRFGANEVADDARRAAEAVLALINGSAA